MAIHLCKAVFAFLFVVLVPVSCKEQLHSLQVHTLLRIKLLLNSPPCLSSWNKETYFCNSEPSVVCYEKSITQLHIVGESGAHRLPKNFSIDSLFTAITKLPSLKVLTLVSLGLWGPLPSNSANLSSLEIVNLTSNFLQGHIPPFISSFQSLQTLILDSNNFSGRLPDEVGSLLSLAVLNVNNNSLYGPLPNSLENLENLRVLVLSNNRFSNDVPDLSSLTNLQVLDLENNALGPRFPLVSAKISRILLRNNRFTFGIPERVQSYYQLKVLDISSNRFVGPFPVSLLSLPSITYLDISDNKFTGMLSENLPCSDDLYLVNLTTNLLTGKLPSCLVSDSKRRVVLYDGNCLGTGDANQKPVYLCKNEALAVGVIPRSRRKLASGVVLALSICGGVIGSIILASITFLVVRKFLARRAAQKPQPRFSKENASMGYTSKFLKDARYITQAMKTGALGLSPYRSFSLEELEAATNNFDSSTYMGEGSLGQMYRGRLRDGSFVAIKCLKLKRNHSTQYFMAHIEMISKLRHHHLVSAIGHCFDYDLDDDSSVSRLLLVFEYVPNGTLRSWISESDRRKLTWAQRVAAVTGVAKGIQFLHTGIVPPLFSSNIKTTNVLLDQNFVAKISSYNLPLLSDNIRKDRFKNFFSGPNEFKNARAKQHQDKVDIYDLGVILLEVISGKPVNSTTEVEAVKDEFHAVITCNDASRKSLVDRTVRNSCSGESVKTMMEICCRCLAKDAAERPSIEDVLWNLQFAAQVQDASQSSDSSPVSPLQPSRVKRPLNQ